MTRQMPVSPASAFLFLLLLLPFHPAVAQTGTPARPNVVFIVLDDVGFADLGCYGSEISTPNMDRLAAGGLRYNNFHTTALCSPTRAALLTGRNHHTVGMRAISNIISAEENTRGKVTKKAAMLPELLREAGYNTFALGKWHLAPMHETTPAGPYDNWPLGRGFDRFYGFLDAETDQWAPALTYDNHRIDPPNRTRRPDYHLSEDLVDRSIEFIRNQQMALPGKPFFLYLAFGAVHAPHHAPRAFIDRYKGRFDKGWDQAREERLARMKKMGIAPANAALAPRNAGVKAWDALSADEKRLFARLQEAYAGFLEHTDHHIGRFLEYLRASGQFDNTLIVLLSDNGASQEGGPTGTVNATLYYNGISEDFADNLRRVDEIGSPRGFSNIPWGWAQAANTPFQRYKQNTHFGGIRDPLIVHWPAGIRDKGAVRTQFHHVTDLTPTVLEVLKINAPDSYRGVPQLPMAGVSLAYTFADGAAPGRKRTQYFEMIGHRAIWHEGWTAVTAHTRGAPFEQDTWELYNTAEDFSAIHDLAAKQPGKLKELQQLWQREAGKYGVPPLDDRTIQLWFPRVAESPQNRSRFTFYPGMDHWNPGAAPDTRGKSWTLTAEVERADRSQEGVLAAYGSLRSGYVWYVRNNRLVFEYNFAGKFTKIESSEELPAGAATLRFAFQKGAGVQGTGVLFVNDRNVGEALIPRTFPFLISWEGFDVGRDSLSPVTDSYQGQGEFAFNGTLRKLVLEIRN
jgi:arylsulfatase A-like enzyme